MIYFSGISDLQFGGDPLGTEHGCHKSRIVKTDAFAAFQSLIYIGKIAAFHGPGFFFVVGDIGDHKVINRSNCFQAVLHISGKAGSLGHCLAVFRKPGILVRVEKGGKFILYGNLYGILIQIGIEIPFYMFPDI